MEALLKNALGHADADHVEIVVEERTTTQIAYAGKELEDISDFTSLGGSVRALVKGGHRIERAVDVLFDGETWHEFAAERLDPKNTHGTGCTLSAAIAANLALGKGLVDAVREAKAYVTRCIRHAPGLGHGTGPMNHFPPAVCRTYSLPLRALSDWGSSTASVASAVESVTARSLFATETSAARAPRPIAFTLPSFESAKLSNQTVAGPLPMTRGCTAATSAGMTNRDSRVCQPSRARAVRPPVPVGV
jgi:hypothetical protein